MITKTVHKFQIKGGKTTLKRYGSKHFSTIAKLRWDKVKEGKKKLKK